MAEDGVRCRRIYCEACEYHNAALTITAVDGIRFGTVGCPRCKFSKVVADDMHPDNVGKVLTDRRPYGDDS